MSFSDTQLSALRPDAIRGVALPRREPYYPSPADWRDEVIYFLLVDRFSDGQEARRGLLDPGNRQAFRPAGWRWDRWAESGGARFQGGTLSGITSKLDYIKNLGATTLWVGPMFKQRLHWNTYHGYAIQDFLEVDPRFGTRKDLVDLIAAAHGKGMRVLLDIVFNHAGDNFVYQDGEDQPPYLPWPQFYERGNWRNRQGELAPNIAGADDGVWPRELQADEYYTRAGEGNLGAGDINDDHAEFRRSDFCGDRDINYDGTSALDDVARCYKYWIALTDCDGFRLDTLKHVSQEDGRNFCGTIKEFAANLGKADFFLVGEVAGSDNDAMRYLQVLGSNLNATLDIGESRRKLHSVAKGLVPPSEYFDFLYVWDDKLGSRRNAGWRHVSILDDHDHVSGDKVRFSSDANPADHQVVAGVAIQLFSLGIPCVYYGTEQAFAGPEKSEREKYLPDYNAGNPPPDKYLREAMFGPEHPRSSGLAGLPSDAGGLDASMPGFGPFGTAGAHCFNPNSAAYTRIKALSDVRKHYPVLRYGRQYQRAISNFGAPFALPGTGEIIAWSRILDDEEALCIVNGNGTAARGGDVLVDPLLNRLKAAGSPWGENSSFFQVVANSAQAAEGASYAGTHPVGDLVEVKFGSATAHVTIRDVSPSEVLVLLNRP